MAEQNRLRRKEKRLLFKDLKKLEHFIGLSRTRLAGYLVQFDQKRTYLIQRVVIAEILTKIRVPVEDFVIDILCDALEHEGMIDYRSLFKGGYANIVEKYMERLETQRQQAIKIHIDSEEGCTRKEEESMTEATNSRDGAESSTLLARSTLSGKIGEWSDVLREESYRQFEKLMEFCQKRQLMLNRSLAERGNCDMI